MTRIELSDVDFSYDGTTAVLRNLSCSFSIGLNLVLGANGSGKSTLLRLAAGVEMPAAGRVAVGGHDLWQEETAARKLLAYAPEHPEVSPYATIAEVVELVARLREQPDSAVSEALEWGGMAELGRRTIRELSKGQRRRAMLAAARIGDPPCLILDEPLEGLDREFAGSFHAWLQHRLDGGATVLLATHRVDDFGGIATRRVTLRDGQLEELGP